MPVRPFVPPPLALVHPQETYFIRRQVLIQNCDSFSDDPPFVRWRSNGDGAHMAPGKLLLPPAQAVPRSLIAQIAPGLPIDWSEERHRLQVVRSQLWAALHLNFAENVAKIVGPQADRQDSCSSEIAASGRDSDLMEPAVRPTTGPRRARRKSVRHVVGGCSSRFRHQEGLSP
jgi:hypothetical protein